MRRILLVQPSLQPPGGGNGVAAWMLHALKDEHALSVLSWQPLKVDDIDRAWGTTLASAHITQYTMPARLRRAFRRAPVPLTQLKISLLLRRCKQMNGAHDVLLSANNEADFGRRGIQYVHYPWGHLPRPAYDLRWYHVSPSLVRAYHAFCTRVGRLSVERIRQNVTLVNSNWTGANIRALYGIDTTTVYPPVAGPFHAVPWAEREDGFVCIGRISPEKELDKVIDIVGAVRASRPDVHLHIVGTPDNAAYSRHIRRRAAACADWIFLEQDLSRAQLAQLAVRHRYGIHGMSEEHFGIAVAEMAGAGNIVFVPNGGGQVEIIGGDDRLLYRTREEAVEKIRTVLASTELQRELCTHLAGRRALFSVERFVDRIRAIVRDFS